MASKIYTEDEIIALCVAAEKKEAEVMQAHRDFAPLAAILQERLNDVEQLKRLGAFLFDIPRLERKVSEAKAAVKEAEKRWNDMIAEYHELWKAYCIARDAGSNP